jgi:hypothetical protein
VLTINRKAVTAIVTGALVSGALLVPQLGSAKNATKAKRSHSFTIVSNGAPKGTRLIAKLTSPQFGKGNGDGQLRNPKATYIFKFPSGTIYGHGVSQPPKGTSVTGTWVVDRGTKKFKGIKGKGTFTGSLATFKFVFKAKATY